MAYPDTSSPLAGWAPRMLSVLRIVAGFLFMLHGAQKLFNFPPGDNGGTVELLSLMGFAGILEFAGGLLILFGLVTRPVAFLLAGEMAVAYFMAHFPKGPLPVQNGGDHTVLFCFIFLYLSVAGPGPWSLDAWRQRAIRR
ncbi:DoxX family protein [Hymenobacter sp. CRA2]|uniref:DoxX family protein n=1 Tax=Hymenobacter sp. CRA2 TaxID=1955620 RepID=UPI00098F8FD4|nr:DoxX family protein [Hymenobacter sp. CRA2]OON70942.1 DoxX family protein [Hymenobacter sp. CRA2]